MNANLFPMVNQTSPAHFGQSGMADLRKIWAVLRRRWRVLAAAIAATMGVTFVWLLVATPIYTATATVLIDPRKTNTIKNDAIVSDLDLDVNTIATEVSLAQSFAVARRVVERLKLNDDPHFAGHSRRSGLFHWIGGLLARGPVEASESKDAGEPASDAAKLRPHLSPEALEVIDQVKSAIRVRRLATTYFIEIAYSDPDPELSATLANAVAESYLDEQAEARSQAAQRAANWLNERVSALRLQLEQSERALAEHRAKYNLANPEGGTLAEQQAGEINTQLVAARANTVEKKAKYDQVQRIISSGGGLAKVTDVMESDALTALRGQEADIARQESDLLTRYGPEHPAIRKIRGQHADINRQIKAEVARIVQTLRSDYEFAEKKEESLEGSLKELTGGQNLNNQAIIHARELERDVETNRTLYESLLTRLKEAQQQVSLRGAESRIVAPAFVPEAPSFPKKWLFLLLAIVGGSGLGIAAISLLEYLENGFTGASQVEQTLDLPLLAIVPMLDKAERSVDGRLVSVAEYASLKPQSRFGESIRSARMMTQLSNIDQPPKVVLVTSSISAEGKTTIAMSLALSAAAASNQRVLLLDCDLRAQSMSKRFGLLEKPGLTDFLTGQIPGERAVYRATSPNLTILPAGTVTANPPDILGSERMRALLQGLRDSYDVIYMDGPPLLPVIDSVVISNFADKIVFVVRWRTTPRNIALRATQLIENSSQKISGVAFNSAQLDQLMNYDPYNTYHHKIYQTYYAQ